MKKTLLVLIVVGTAIVSSCSSSAAANKMADEMCIAMEKYKESDPMTMLDAAGDMMTISKKTEEYGSVTDAQLRRAMLKKCPEGWKKFEALKGK
jgi:hypothetical protein